MDVSDTRLLLIFLEQASVCLCEPLIDGMFMFAQSAPANLGARLHWGTLAWALRSVQTEVRLKANTSVPLPST